MSVDATAGPIDYLLKRSALEFEAGAYLVNRKIEDAVDEFHDKGVWSKQPSRQSNGPFPTLYASELNPNYASRTTRPGLRVPDYASR